MCIGLSIQVKFHDTFLVVHEAASGVPIIITVIGTLIIIIAAFGAVALLKCNLKIMRLVSTVFSRKEDTALYIFFGCKKPH